MMNGGYRFPVRPLLRQVVALTLLTASIGHAADTQTVLVPPQKTVREDICVEVKKADTNPLSLSVEKTPAEQWQGNQVPLDEGAVQIQSYLPNMSAYKPMYFLLGVDPGLGQSKFQFSFKYRLFSPGGWLADKAPWLKGFHMGYTQRSFWDLKSDSKPFDDTSYMPELFYLLPKIDLHVNRITAFGLQGGFQHESNGKGGDDSRSTNYIYLKPVMGFHLAGPFKFIIAPKVFTYIDNEEESNGNLDDYRGYVDLEMGIVDPDGIALTSHMWFADKGTSLQLDLTYPLTRLLGQSLNLYLQAQYFTGYGETLLNYDRRHDVFRLGFAIVR